ncbi:MAG: glycosyltransferase [Elusimicrobiota bacterium]
MNKLLLKIIEEYRPDIFFVLMGDGILPQTLEKIQKMGIVTVNWFHDSVVAPIRIKFVQEISPYYDFFFMIDSEDILKYTKISSRWVKTVPLGCIPELHRGVKLSDDERSHYGSDVCFVGTMKFKRAEVLKSLTNFNLGIWGNWLEKKPELKNCYRRQNVFGEEAVKIYNAAKIVLDIHLSYGTGDKKFNVTPRLFEVPASQTFLLADENAAIADLYKIGEEIICYQDENDLKEKIQYYLTHSEERKLIVQRGQQRAYRDHTYEKRLKEIFSIIEKKN